MWQQQKHQLTFTTLNCFNIRDKDAILCSICKSNEIIVTSVASAYIIDVVASFTIKFSFLATKFLIQICAESIFRGSNVCYHSV